MKCSTNWRHRSCPQVNTTETVVDPLVLQHEYIHADAAQLLSYLSFAKCLPAFFSTLFICFLTDSMGRRFGLLLPCVGGLASCLGWASVVYYNASLSYLYVANVIDGFCGSYLTLQSSTFAYFADLITTDRRSMRYMSALALVFGATGIGNIAAGYLIATFGYLNALYVVATMFAVAGLHVVLLLPESLPDERLHKRPFCVKAIAKRSVSVFNIYWRSSDGESPNKLRFLLLVFIAESLIVLGRNDVDLLYIVGVPFCWTSVMVGYFQASGFLLKALAGFMLIPVLQLWLSTTTICFIGCGFGLVSSLVMTLADTGYLLWTGRILMPLWQAYYVEKFHTSGRLERKTSPIQSPRLKLVDTCQLTAFTTIHFFNNVTKDTICQLFSYALYVNVNTEYHKCSINFSYLLYSLRLYIIKYALLNLVHRLVNKLYVIPSFSLNYCPSSCPFCDFFDIPHLYSLNDVRCSKPTFSPLHTVGLIRWKPPSWVHVAYFMPVSTDKIHDSIIYPTFACLVLLDSCQCFSTITIMTSLSALFMPASSGKDTPFPGPMNSSPSFPRRALFLHPVNDLQCLPSCFFLIYTAGEALWAGAVVE